MADVIREPSDCSSATHRAYVALGRPRAAWGLGRRWGRDPAGTGAPARRLAGGRPRGRRHPTTGRPVDSANGAWPACSPRCSASTTSASTTTSTRWVATPSRQRSSTSSKDTGVRLPTAPPDVSRCGPRGTHRTIPPDPTHRVVGFGTELPGPPLFCLMAAFQARTFACAFNERAGRPFYAVQQAGLEGRSRVDRTIRKRARRARRRHPRDPTVGPVPARRLFLRLACRLEAARRMWAAGEQVGLYAVIDMWAPVESRLRRSWDRGRAGG